MDKEIAETILAELVEKGLVEMVSDTEYKLTDAGLVYVAELLRTNHEAREFKARAEQSMRAKVNRTHQDDSDGKG